MQTSLQRRQRHRRSGAARRGSGGNSARRIALAIPLLLFSSFLVLGAVGFITAVSAYAYYSKDLPDPQEAFNGLTFDSPTTVLDRTGQVQLATFGEHRRELVTFDQIPPEMVDATTSIEDKDFWTNPGFDLGGFIAATVDTLTGHPRGGSTITQQLVRARLLPDSAFTGSVYDRKIKEIIQSVRLTQANNGITGKQKIMEAYLNQNFYGNQSYGIAAAAQSYFGKDLKDLTLAQMAILAAIPQSPTDYDLVRNAIEQCTVTVAANAECPAGKSELVVPDTAGIVQRRNQVLSFMETRSVLSAQNHTTADYEAAMHEPVILASQVAPPWKAPQFVWQVREQLGALLCGVESKSSCEQVDTGGYQVTTTLDWTMQQTMEKWLRIAARSPQASLTTMKAQLRAAKIPESDWSWLLYLRGKNINNDAGVAIDYRTGQIYAYSGSAGYYLPGTKTFQPQYDVMSDGFRQMGSAVKPINYVTAIDQHIITAASVFMDVVTNFGHGFTPTDDDHLERGPVRARSALQFSLNIPAIKLSLMQGLDHLYQKTLDFGFVYPSTVTGPVASEGIGTLEMHAIDLTSAYGAIADGGMLVPRTTILQVKDRNGNVIYPTPQNAPPAAKSVVSPQAAYVVTDILNGNTLKSQNAYWARWAVYDKGKRRPAAVKTGTTDNSKDVTAFGWVAPPTDPKKPAIVVGVWMGNSDSSPTAPDVLSTTSSEALWSHIIAGITAGTPIVDFKAPKGIVHETVDAYSGQPPSPYTVKTVDEVFIAGTQPKGPDTLHVATQIDSATGKLWENGCDGPVVTKGFLDFSSMEPSFPAWQPFTQDWAQRAAKGAGVRGGPKKNATTYFVDGFLVPFGRTWGGSFAPTDVCQPGGQQCGPGNGNGPPDASPTVCPSQTPPGPTPTPGPTPSHGKPTPLPSLKLPLPTAPP